LQSRDFTYVENVVSANLKAAEADGIAGRVFNVACGGRYSLLDLLARLKTLVGTDVRAIYEAPRAGDVRDSQASIDDAASGFGYEVAVDFEEGLRRTVDWYKASGSR
jgi:nucleoside-diphosphate-sugar epimerase